MAPPRGASRLKVAVVGNGRSVHALGRSAAIAARGHEVRLVTVGPVLPGPGVDVRTRPLPATPWSAIAAAHSFLEDVSSFGADLLHLHYAGGKLGTLATLTDVRPLVVTVMGGDVLPEQHPGGWSRLERRATHRILAAADLLLVKSDALRPALEAFGPIAARVETVRWGVDAERFRPEPGALDALRARLGLFATDLPLLSPRTLAPLYNVHLLVEAMPAILTQAPGVVLLLTEYNADAAYRQRLASRITALGLDHRVRFVGAIPAGDMPAWHALARAVVMVPSSDGLPQSLFESMAAGTPVVLGNLPGYAEVVRDGETALLCDLAPAAIAQAVVRVVTDDVLHRSLAGAARARVAECASLPREVARVETLYREVLATGARGARGGRWRDALSLFLR